MHSKPREKSISAYLLFLIWPFLSIIIAFYDYRQTWAKNIIWLFVTFYGYTMVISNEGMDANYYRDNFVETTESDVTINGINLYSENSQLDILQPLLNVVVSRFTDNYKILFAIYGLIFGFFFSRNLWMLLCRLKHPETTISIVLLITFSLINPIWNINGFRFWTAAQIFVYGILLYVLDGNRKGIYLVLTTFLVHFSFMFPITIMFIYLFAGNRLTTYFYFFLASLFISELNLEMVKTNLEQFLPTAFESKINSYTNESYLESKLASVDNSNWYVMLYIKTLRYSIYAFLIFIYYRGSNYIKTKSTLLSLFCFILLFFGIANIVSSIPSVGRFITVSMSFSIVLIFLFIQTFEDKIMNYIVKISFPALFLYIIVTIRLGFNTIGITTVIGNPVLALFMENDKALIELIK